MTKTNANLIDLLTTLFKLRFQHIKAEFNQIEASNEIAQTIFNQDFTNHKFNDHGYTYRITNSELHTSRKFKILTFDL